MLLRPAFIPMPLWGPDNPPPNKNKHTKRGFKHWYLQGKIIIEPPPLDMPELGDCWVFIGALTQDGYGQISHKKGDRWVHSTAHRFFFELYRRVLGTYEEAAHRCHRRLCVRPKHLYAATRLQNRADRFTVPSWTQAQRTQIRELLDDGLPHSQIADLMRCPRAAIHRFAREYRRNPLDLFDSSPSLSDTANPDCGY